ncbi:hypothetical protein Dimus_003946, partial [Dionaea muscipula]
WLKRELLAAATHTVAIRRTTLIPKLLTMPGRSLHGAEAVCRCRCPMWLSAALPDEGQADAARSFTLLMDGCVGARRSCLRGRDVGVPLLAARRVAARSLRLPDMGEKLLGS